MNYYGNPITRLIEQLAGLPGIGGKSAQRLAFHIIHMPEEKVAALAGAILEAKQQVHYCSVCCNLTDEDPCPVCANPNRDTAPSWWWKTPEIWQLMSAPENSTGYIMYSTAPFLP